MGSAVVSITGVSGKSITCLWLKGPQQGSTSKLDMAAQMCDAAGKYLSKVADALREKDIDVELISAGIPAEKIDYFIEKNGIDLIVSGDGRSGLGRGPAAASLGDTRSSSVNTYLG